jgi:segregation and condensation protein B
VDVTASLDTLVERRFVHIAGRKESPGRPFFYRTAPEFLRHFGIKSIESLPRMALPSVEEQTTAEPAPVAVEAPNAPAADHPSHG